MTIKHTSDGGYILGGYSNYDMYLLKIDAEGNKEWSHRYGGDDIEIGCSAQQTNDGGYVIAGYSDTSPGFMQYWLVKTDESGNEEWNKAYGNSGEDWPLDVKQTNDGGYIITGSINTYWEKDLWIIKADEQGNMIWDIIYGDDDLETGYSIEQTFDGGYIIAGEKKNINSGYSDVLLVRVDSDSIVSTDDIITENRLSSYPNPFRISTTINYTLPHNIREAGIEIYNIKGQKIEELSVSNDQSSVEWNAEGLSSGIYLYKLNIQNSGVKKLILLN